jgi:hypothetical protein
MDYHYQHTGNTNVHTDRTTLPEQYCTNTSSNIRQWLCGTWNPATISTATVGTTTYTFTPTDPCATTATMDITIGTQVTPTFTQIGPLCQNSTAPALPATSDNGFAGTWNPATISTATVGTTTYTFTPTDPCATTCNNGYHDGTQVTPTFTQIGPLCQNSTAPTSATSDNGFAEPGTLQRSVQQQ